VVVGIGIPPEDARYFDVVLTGALLHSLFPLWKLYQERVNEMKKVIIVLALIGICAGGAVQAEGMPKDYSKYSGSLFRVFIVEKNELQIEFVDEQISIGRSVAGVEEAVEATVGVIFDRLEKTGYFRTVKYIFDREGYTDIERDYYSALVWHIEVYRQRGIDADGVRELFTYMAASAYREVTTYGKTGAYIRYADK